MYVTPDRAKVLTYTNPPHIIDFATFTPPLPQTHDRCVSLLEPFETMIWIFLILFSVTNYCLNYVLIRDKYRIFWVIYSILVRQSQAIPTKTTVRLQILSWYLSVGVVLTAFYSGSVFSQITIPTEFGRIDTIQDLAEATQAGRVKVISIGGFIHKMIKVNNN